MIGTNGDKKLDMRRAAVGRKHSKGDLEGFKQRGWAGEEGKSKNIWGNCTAEEPFA
jgi:hypothetical protein